MKNPIALLLISIFPALVAAQDETSDKKVLMRFTSFGLADAGGEFVLAAGEGLTPPFAIPDNGFSAPMPPPESGPAFALGKADETPFRSLATITLPDAGKRFLVIVFPGKGDALRTLVVRADDPAFRPGHVMILNFADQPIAADLGGEKHRFDPGSRTIFRPRRKDDLANYQVRFYHAKNGKPKLFAANLWPHFDKKRAFVFLHSDPGTGSPSYRAIDEFTDWLEK